MIRIFRFVGAIARKAKSVHLRGKGSYCPLCNNQYRLFMPAGVRPRKNAVCPGCGSYERHRLLWIALESLELIKAGGRLLHVAPEPCLEKKFRKVFDYLSIDLDGARAMRAMDLTNLKLPDEEFDLVICNHVLEHIPDDRRALSELHRVMKSGGYGSIQVPMQGETTIEDLSITDPHERERLYGQRDHVRMYGADFRCRLREAGFQVLEFAKEDLLGGDKLKRLAVECEHSAILVRKQPLPIPRPADHNINR